jgi:sigma-B regulation protein RsbU (phosphoserine phosphatase)
VYVVVTVPGVMISFFRSTRIQDQFDLRFIQTEYEQVREEILAAKSIHERAFPEARLDGAIRFQYIYKPMSQIGGDYLFASVMDPSSDKSPVTLVLFDVTGHGIAAALTANRLQGELARIIGEDPEVEPAALLTLLNRYVCLTLSDSAVLVTAIAMKADPSANTMTAANAGHPDGVVRLGSGELKHVEASSAPLGVVSDDGFMVTDQVYPFAAGDSMVAFTDGVTEARNKAGDFFGLEGIERVLAYEWVDTSQRWPENILNGVKQHRAGSATDDILIVELYRP